MTCIVGYEDNGKVYIGGDSLGSTNWTMTVRADQKVFKNGPMLFGFTSSYRMGQILNHSLVIPEQSSKQSDYNYLCTTFIDAVMAALIDKKYAKVNDGCATGGYFLLGYKGCLYKIESDFQVGKTVDPYDSCGSGEHHAKGAMAILNDMKIKPQTKIKRAIEAAAKNVISVGGPIHILSI